MLWRTVCSTCRMAVSTAYLVVPIPDSVKLEEASFVGLGAIAIHALRKASLQFGETIVVVGLGIIGQLVSQIAYAASYRVIAYDVLAERRNQLQKLMPEDRLWIEGK